MAPVERITPVRSETRDGLEQVSELMRDALQMVLLVLRGWVDREQSEGIASLREENRAMKVQLGGRRLRLVVQNAPHEVNDNDRHYAGV